jgi:GrpB-like predicted nucleotidyltransferase (UPF0157 family)
MARVVVHSYSSDWPEQFRVVRAELLTVFAPLEVAIEHIGSTSVPGLAAKPVLDLLLGADSLAEIESKVGAIGRLGFEYVPKYEREIPERRYFVRPAAATLRIHLHGVVRDSRLWREHLGFRDALRAEPLLRSEYQALKLRLAREFAEDKAAYTEAKGPFIRAVLARIGEERKVIDAQAESRNRVGPARGERRSLAE